MKIVLFKLHEEGQEEEEAERTALHASAVLLVIGRTFHVHADCVRMQNGLRTQPEASLFNSKGMDRNKCFKFRIAAASRSFYTSKFKASIEGGNANYMFRGMTESATKAASSMQAPSQQVI